MLHAFQGRLISRAPGAHLGQRQVRPVGHIQPRKALSELDDRGRLLLELDMTNALRPSELFGLRWKCFNEAASSISVTETVYKGKIRPWGKTQRSLATVHLPKDLAKQFAAWRQQAPDPSPEAFIFPNQTGGFWTRTTTGSGCFTNWRKTWGCQS